MKAVRNTGTLHTAVVLVNKADDHDLQSGLHFYSFLAQLLEYVGYPPSKLEMTAPCSLLPDLGSRILADPKIVESRGAQ